MGTPKGDSNQFQRALVIGARLATGGEITTEFLRERFKVSRATAKRDMFWTERVMGPEVATEANGRKTLRLKRYW